MQFLKRPPSGTFDYIRDVMEYPIEYKGLHRGYICTDPLFPMSVIDMSEGELVAMLLVERLAHQYGEQL